MEELTKESLDKIFIPLWIFSHSFTREIYVSYIQMVSIIH